MAKKQLTQADRVSISLARKVGKADFGSADIHLSYSTDAQPGETPKQAMRRAAKFVQAQLDKRVGMLEDM